jgi:hypothetical protein
MFRVGVRETGAGYDNLEVFLVDMFLCISTIVLSHVLSLTIGTGWGMLFFVTSSLYLFNREERHEKEKERAKSKTVFGKQA